MWYRARSMFAIALATSSTTVVACTDHDDEEPVFTIVAEELPGALLSVWGTSEADVWMAGGDPDQRGPTVLHFDGAAWKQLDTGVVGDFWWVFGFEDGPVYFGGVGGVIVQYDHATETFTSMTTPGTDTVFGIWGASPTELWAVGGATGGASGAFAWRLDGDVWVEAPGFPDGLAETDALWKVYGRDADDVWMVGTNGKVVRWNGSALALETTGTGESLFTVHANAERFVAVGGFGTGAFLENDGTGWENVSPNGAAPVVGVCMGEGDDGYAVGQFGAMFRRDADGWREETLDAPVDESLHAVWIDPTGGVWAVGGRVLTQPLVRGIILHRGDAVPGLML